MTTKYSREILEPIVMESISVQEVMRTLGVKMAGGTHSHISKKIIEFKIDTSHFKRQGWNRGNVSTNRLCFDEILVFDRHGGRKENTDKLRRAMLESGIELRCECGLTDEWNGAKIVIEIDHIDGNNLNNLKENLRFLCPNCHSQQVVTNMPHKHRTRL